MNMTQVGIAIRGLRLARGMTPRELGLKAGLTGGKQIEHIEAGRRGAPLSRIEKIASALGVEVEVRLVPKADDLGDRGSALLLRLVEAMPRDPDRWGVVEAQIEQWEKERARFEKGEPTR